MANEINGFATSLVLELAKVSRAIYPGPTNQKLFKLMNQPIEHQRYVHGSFNRGFCRIFMNDKAVVIAFRGTREKIIDFRIANLKAFPVPLRNCNLNMPVFVHRGFQATLDYLDKTSGLRSLDAIYSILDEINVDGRELYITGHSLGGAIAVIFATKLRSARPELVRRNLRGVVTFGAPASGLSAFYRNYTDLNELTLRLVNASDVIPFTPPIGYRHVGKSAWLVDGSVKDDPGWWRRLHYSLSLMSPRLYLHHHSMTEYIKALAAVAESGSDSNTKRLKIG